MNLSTNTLTNGKTVGGLADEMNGPYGVEEAADCAYATYRGKRRMRFDSVCDAKDAVRIWNRNSAKVKAEMRAAATDAVCPALPAEPAYMVVRRPDGSAYITATATEHRPYDPPPTWWTESAARLVLDRHNPDRLPARTMPSPGDFARAMAAALRPAADYTLPMFPDDGGRAA